MNEKTMNLTYHLLDYYSHHMNFIHYELPRDQGYLDNNP